MPVTLTYVFIDWINGLFARSDGKVGLGCVANKSSSASEKAKKLSGGNSDGDGDDIKECKTDFCDSLCIKDALGEEDEGTK